MRAGLLDQRIDILRGTKADTKLGTSTKTTWNTVKEGVSASVTYGQSGFGVADGEAVYKQQVTFLVRYTPDIREYDRISWGGRLYRITGIQRRQRTGRMDVITELLTQD